MSASALERVIKGSTRTIADDVSPAIRAVRYTKDILPWGPLLVLKALRVECVKRICS